MPSFRCPKCHALVAGEPDAQGVVVCGQCGARLRTRASAAPPASPAVPAPPPAPSAPESQAPAPASSPPSTPPSAALPADEILAELRALRQLQEQILALLQRGPVPSEPAGADTFGFAGMGGDDDGPAAAPAPPPVRSRRRKSVLLIDDDETTRQAAITALQAADVPTRSVGEGNAALAAIAEEKPDVIVIELAMGGAMAGKDVINMIKATMEWVDVPIVLYTRAAVGSQKEARTIHGADEYVLKEQGAATLVNRVIQIFRR